VDVTTAHVAFGALTFMVGWLLLLVTSPRTVAETQKPLESIATDKIAELKHA
jgi:hypothetical protein